MTAKQVRPHITEKSLRLASKGWYTFATDRFTRKHEITQEINRVYTVTVTSVRTSIMHGKTRRIGKKMMTKVAQNWKKAMVRLTPGQTIPAFEVTQEVEKK